MTLSIGKLCIFDRKNPILLHQRLIPLLGNTETATVVAGVSDPGYSLTPATARQPQSDCFREMGLYDFHSRIA